MRLSFNFYDASGRLLDTDFTYSTARTIGPGKKSPFEESISTPSGYHRYTIAEVSFRAAREQPNNNFTARVTNRYVQYGYENFVGEITNNNTTASEFVKVIFTFYGSGGQVVDTDFTYVDGSNASLGAGANGTFNESRDTKYVSYSSYTFFVESSTPPTGQPQPSPTPSPSPSGRQGYWMVGQTGDVYAFGGAGYFGAPAKANGAAFVDLEPTTSGNGYWVVNAVGHVFSFGDARYQGGGPALIRGEQITSLSRTADGGGYWLFSTLGRAFAFGNATHFGDMAGRRLNGPVLDSIPTPSGRGYYMVASDGGIFTFGDAAFHGSMGATRLNAPVQSLVPDPDGVGYWLVASDGGIFAFNSSFYGSMGSTRLNRPITGMVGFGNGYLMVAEDGGIFTFGNAPFHGSLGNNPPAFPIVSAAVLNR